MAGVLIVCPPAQASCAWQHTVLTAQVQKAINELAQEKEFPGSSVAVVLPDECILTYTTGYSDVSKGIPMRADTLFLAGSIGKSFVAAVAIAASNAGKLALDDKIALYLQNEPWFRRLPNAGAITIRMLLNHSSGIANHVDSRKFRDFITAAIRANPEFSPKPEDLIEFVLDQPALFPAGGGFQYSDTNYILAGLVIEHATGRTVYELAQSQLLKPLALNKTRPSNTRRIAGLATGYWEPEDNYFDLPSNQSVKDGLLAYNPALEWTGGGFASTATDLARWMKLLHSGRALPAAYRDELYCANLFPPDPRGKRYALGVEIWRTSLGKVYGHSGAIPGYQSFAAYSPDHNIAIAVLVNKQLALTDAALNLLQIIARDAQHQP